MSGRPPGLESDAGLDRLPPGRHGLPPEVVTRNQRGRLTAGMIAVVAANGYQASTVAQIVDAAGVSRRTFYTYFSSKEDCFFDSYDSVLRFLHLALDEAVDEGEKWPVAVRSRIAVCLDIFAANPDLARFCLVAPARGGPDVAARHRQTIAAALTELTKGRPAPPASGTPSRAVQESVLAGMVALLVRKVEAGEGRRLTELLPDLLNLFLTPFIGPGAARRFAHP